MTEQDLRKILSTNIKRYRKYRKWSQEELAGQLNISIPFLSDIENGRKWISPTTMVKFAETLCIEPYELFKPKDELPNDMATILTKYTDETIAIVTQSLTDARSYYLSQISGSE
jgi:transcriptional regulator with XRE-family HTH domain